MDHRIVGTTLPVLEMTLAANESIVSEPGELSWMSANVSLRTSTAMAGQSGVFGVLKRAIGGGSIFMTEFTPQGGPGMVAFAAKIPGQILDIDVAPNQGYMCHKHGFVCATPGVELSIGFQQSLGAGVFGGNGFILQKIAGTAKAWVELGGEIVVYDLQPNQQLLVHPGHVGMFQEQVRFEITMLRGIKNILFGSDGLFLAKLTGPGRVWLQSMTLANLAHAIAGYLGRETTTSAVGGGVAGAMLKGLLDQS